MFKQCVLKKNSEIQVAWLPEVFAHKGFFVKLRNKKTKNWDDGWEIISESIHSVRLTEEQLTEYAQDYRNQRKQSDR